MNSTRPFALLSAGEMIWLVLSLVVFSISLAVALYLIKKRTGSHGWRIRAPLFAQRAFTFVIWLVFKKVPWKPIVIWGPWVVIILGCAFYGIENWRGERAWAQVERAALDRGEKLKLSDWHGAPIPDEENFARHPVFLREYARSSRDPIPDLTGWNRPIRQTVVPDPRTGLRVSVSMWMANPGDFRNSEAAARHVLAFLETHRSRLEALRGAVRERAGIHLPIGKGDWEYEMIHVGRLLRNWTELFQVEGHLRLAVGDLDGAVDDFRTSLRLASYLVELRGGLTSAAFDWVAHLDALLWEILQQAEFDPGLFADVERYLASLDTRVDALDEVRFWRAYQLELLDDLVRHRSHAEDWGWQVSYLDLLPDWAPGWADEGQDWVNGMLFRFAPRGWYAHCKARLLQYHDDALLRPDGVELDRIAVDAQESLQREWDGLGRSFREKVVREIIGFTTGGFWGATFQQVRIDLMRIALALERSRKKRGAYPATLAELVPEFIAELPRDPCVEMDYRYRIKEDGTPLIYSVGEDGVDDGGRSGKSRSRGSTADWAWQYTLAGSSSR